MVTAMESFVSLEYAVTLSDHTAHPHDFSISCILIQFSTPSRQQLTVCHRTVPIGKTVKKLEALFEVDIVFERKDELFLAATPQHCISVSLFGRMFQWAGTGLKDFALLIAGASQLYPTVVHDHDRREHFSEVQHS